MGSIARSFLLSWDHFRYSMLLMNAQGTAVNWPSLEFDSYGGTKRCLLPSVPVCHGFGPPLSSRTPGAADTLVT
ncbi:hypothetical protein RSOLAG1IB_09641 [Rhizoctonia solani AG-1 IB]|uniref:Uncharacterized protein n=1 Tax=Thanatephorus cucumeris (strain AG1-IB / isolate 7/3/14) TaxID=1108050 RepID=A0A0B7FRX3_THACB|nr:hypothetical protein RSOLAG1IB_09641 [Rhizoctonia solani AG-1 IB]